MKYRLLLPGLLLLSIAILCSCQKQHEAEKTRFTKADSLTDTYLQLKDSMLHTWNAMINDDNHKIKAMKQLLHELKVSAPSQIDQLKSYEERLGRLTYSRYTQKSMGNADVVEEYDFASNSLVSELISLAESQTQFAYNTTLQKLVDNIRTADERITMYREEYDQIASQFNTFIEQNKETLKEVDQDTFLQKKPLFQMASEQ